MNVNKGPQKRLIITQTEALPTETSVWNTVLNSDVWVFMFYSWRGNILSCRTPISSFTPGRGEPELGSFTSPGSWVVQAQWHACLNYGIDAQSRADRDFYPGPSYCRLTMRNTLQIVKVQSFSFNVWRSTLFKCQFCPLPPVGGGALQDLLVTAYRTWCLPVKANDGFTEMKPSF